MSNRAMISALRVGWDERAKVLQLKPGKRRDEAFLHYVVGCHMGRLSVMEGWPRDTTLRSGLEGLLFLASVRGELAFIPLLEDVGA